MSAAPVLHSRAPSMASVLTRLPRLARAQRATLIQGETGVGKEVIARRLHELSPRAHRPFITIHCGAIPDNLVEGELFGHEKGSFTGAQQRRAGLIRMAGEGTLFLDEVNSLSPHAQSRLLRFLESGEFRPVGADEAVRSSAWIIAATNEDPDTLVGERRFRRDLLFRLDAVRLTLPALRERREDLLELAQHFLARVNPSLRLGPSVEAALLAHDWPGNVRELRNRVETAALLCEGAIVEPDDLGLLAPPPSPLALTPSLAGGLDAQLWSLVKDQGLSLADALGHCERLLIQAALEQEGDNRTRAAQRLGIHVRTIFKKLAPEPTP